MTISASEVRQIFCEELAKALHPSVMAPRVADGMGGFKTAAIYDPREDATYQVRAVVDAREADGMGGFIPAQPSPSSAQQGCD